MKKILCEPYESIAKSSVEWERIIIIHFAVTTYCELDAYQNNFILAFENLQLYDDILNI